MLVDFYAEIIKLNDYCLILKEDSNNLGFLVCGYRTHEAVSNFIKSHRLSLIRVLLVNPRFAVEKAGQITAKIIKKNKQEIKITPCRLLSISVHPDHYRKGIAKSLICELERRLLENRIMEYGLSVKPENTAAIRLYEKLGFVKEYVDKSIYYKKKLFANQISKDH